MNKHGSVLVTGATGKQGGAVADALLRSGQQIRVLTRRPDSPAAVALQARGASLAVGSFDDQDSLRAALAGQDAVFAVSTFLEGGTDTEVRQGRALIAAAKAAGIAHFVFTSVAAANQSTGIPHFDSKAALERELVESGLPHTIIAPAYFFENLLIPQVLDGVRGGVYAAPLPADRPLAQISVSDIGAFGALVLARREAFLGRRIDIASQYLSGNDTVATLSRVLGRPLGYFEVPLPAIKAQSEDLASMYGWFARVGFTIDTAALKAEYPEVPWLSFDTWANQQDFAALGLTAPTGQA
ncbi:MAG TPA: NmrA/HSCARG family protein [Pseudomonadota bacterium]|nr:NmrA/HSCARG family protein [Pseudomonadota bacterium]